MAYAYRTEQTRNQPLSDWEKILIGQSIGSRDRVSDDPWTVPAFYNAVRIYASAIARTDCFVRKIMPNGAKQDDRDHEAFWVLSWKANTYTTYFNWMRTLVANCLA